MYSRPASTFTTDFTTFYQNSDHERLQTLRLWETLRACLHGGGGTPGRWGNPSSRGRNIQRVYIQSYNPRILGWGFLRLLLRLKLRSLSRGFPSSHLEKDERLILGHICLFMKALCYAVFGFARNPWLNTLYRIVWQTNMVDLQR